MRIPEEAAIRFYLPKRNANVEEPEIEAVDGPTAGRDALARERLRNDRRQEKKAREGNPKETPHTGEERRQHDRRKRQEDVLLDTRTTPSRRSYPSIDEEA